MAKAFRYLFLFLLSAGVLVSCKKTEYVYQIENENLYPDNAGKVKVKSDEQFVSILYANLFQEALGANELVRVVRCIRANGDKDLIHEVLVSNFMNRADVQLPEAEFMRANPDSFVVETYKRFLVRYPTEAEKTWFRNYINTHPTVTPEIVYASFAISNEYQFY
jgi:hypothetical protein